MRGKIISEKKFLLLLAMVTILAIILITVLFSATHIAYAEEGDDETTTLDKYVKNEYRNMMSFDKAELVINVAGDDKIVEYIPKECFMQEGQYMHINDDYGYYIYTFPDGIFANPSGEFTSFGNMTLGDVFDLFKN